MSTKTTNYNLVKPADNESADISIINANMDIIDTKLKTIDEKASSITVPVTKVNNKTGDVVLSAADIKMADGKTIEEEVTSHWTENVTQFSNVNSDITKLKYRMYMGV